MLYGTVSGPSIVLSLKIFARAGVLSRVSYGTVGGPSIALRLKTGVLSFVLYGTVSGASIVRCLCQMALPALYRYPSKYGRGAPIFLGDSSSLVAQEALVPYPAEKDGE